MSRNLPVTVLLSCLALLPPKVAADESLLGYVKGAETLPAGAWELDQTVTYRGDKGRGDYAAWNLATELEYGVTSRFTGSVYLKFQAIDTDGLVIDGYLPGPRSYGPRASGSEVAGKYMFLSPAKDGIGLASYSALSYDWLDPHSGRDKDTISFEQALRAQKYFLEGQLVTLLNAGLEATYADRGAITGLPPGFDWPTKPEMEIEFIAGAGISYRFMPNWSAGVETVYETEYETEVGQERWSLFLGPSLHYASGQWWATFTWFPQIVGGGETYPGQPDDLHLIEKTRHELRLKIGFEF